MGHTKASVTVRKLGRTGATMELYRVWKERLAGIK